MDHSSEESTDSKKSALNSHGNASSKTTKNEKRLIRRVIAKLVSKDENELAQKEERFQKQVNEVEHLEKTTRAKSVGRGTSERCRRSSSYKAKRSKSMTRSERKSELTVTTDRMESSEKERATFHKKVAGMERDNFIRGNLGLKPKYSIENLKDKISQDSRRNRRSRSRSEEKDDQLSRKRWREESCEYREDRRYIDKSHAELSEDSPEYREYKRYRDKSHAELREDSPEYREYKRYRDFREDSRKIKEQRRNGEHSSAEQKEESLELKEQVHYSDHYHAQGREVTQWNAERRTEIPCKYFNFVGFCKYKSSHTDVFGNRKLHICASCYYERGQKRDHGQVDCNHSMKETTPRNDCNAVDDACTHFNNGNCWHKYGGHVSRGGKYVRLHICAICFKYGERKSHSAIDCKFNESRKKHSEDSPTRERFESKAHDRHDSRQDEKPCGFFNNNGSCRYVSGHNPSSGLFPKQLHICSCCIEFLGEARNHPAINCDFKKVLVGERKKFVVPELPCNSFNSGKCDLKSGHRLSRGELRFYHICKFCVEYREEKNSHTLEECKFRKKLLQEVKGESQSKYTCRKKDAPREKETGNDELKSKIPKEITEKRSSSMLTEKPIKISKESKQSASVMPNVSRTDNMKKSGELKTANAFKVCLIKRKTSKASDRCVSISPCRQAKPTEEVISQAVSKINKVVKLVKEGSSTKSLTPVHRDSEEAKPDTSIESDGEKVVFEDANPPKTFLKNREQESGLILPGGPREDDQRKLNDPPLLPRKQLEAGKEEHGNKRRKLERSTPQDVNELDCASDSAGESKYINEKETHCDKGLLPVDDVLKSLNGEVLQIDSETKMDVNEILKKLEQLENLHTIEVENLRKARQHSKKAIGNSQKNYLIFK